jgi:cytochrome b561
MASIVEPRSPGLATRAIHWAIALLVLSAWVVGSTMEELPRGAARSLAVQIHYSLGVLVLGFAALRVAWRTAAPPPHSQEPSFQRLAAKAMHWALAILTFAVPLSGLLDRWARGRAVTVFGGLPLPAPFTIPGGRAWGEVHEALASVMLALIAVHVAAALWHQLILRDRALSRMVKG